MIKYSFIRTSIIIFLSLIVFGHCKSTRRSFSEPPSPNDISADQKCYHNGKLTKTERKQIFPFSDADKIKIISFSSQLGKTPIVNDTIILTKTTEAILLSEDQKNNLSDILYNYNYSKNSNLISETTQGCYFPRHAIVFFDKSDKVISFIEICLECSQVVSELPKESIGNFCEGKYDLLKKYFLSIGIKQFKD
jgi:hypothetical protein